MSTDNLELWNKVCKTDRKMTKEVTLGKRRFTAIDQTYQNRRATELWGPFGKGWGLRDLECGYVSSADGLPIEIWAQAIFFYPGGEFPISADMEWRKNWDCRKKLYTELWKKALAYLGFSADIYMGEHADDRYAQQEAYSAKKAPDIIEAIQGAPDIETLDKYYEAAKKRGLLQTYMDQVTAAWERRREQLEGESTF